MTKPDKDPRSQHRAIQVLRGLMERYPPKLLWDDLIGRLKDNFDADRLTECRKAWLMKGYNPNALFWIDWYFDGIPEHVRRSIEPPAWTQVGKYIPEPELSPDEVLRHRARNLIDLFNFGMEYDDSDLETWSTHYTAEEWTRLKEIYEEEKRLFQAVE